MLCKYSGLTQREAAAMLNLSSGAAVSLQLKKLEKALLADRQLRRQVLRVEKAVRKRNDGPTGR